MAKGRAIGATLLIQRQPPRFVSNQARVPKVDAAVSAGVVAMTLPQ